MSTFHYGPRSARAPALPVIRPGIDPLPTHCARGHSGPHDAAPPLGTDRYGLVTCRSCGQSLAWTDPLPRGVPMPSTRQIVISARRRLAAFENTSWRRPGCAMACRREQHSPEAHEDYGRRSALAEAQARAEQPHGIVRTGPLSVDFDTNAVTADGAPVVMTPYETLILFDLAAHLGTVRTHEAIVRAVWGDAQAELWGRRTPRWGAWHIMRVNVTRVRKKLGEAADLLETVKGFGYLLRAEPPSEETPR